MKKYKLKEGTEILKMMNKDIVLQDDKRWSVFNKQEITYSYLDFLFSQEYVEVDDVFIVKELKEFPFGLYIEEVKVGYYNYFRLNKPVIDDPYFYIDESGKIYRRYWEDDNEDNYCWNNNNCFVDEDTAETFKSNNDRFAPLLKKMEVEFAKGGEIESGDGKKYYIYHLHGGIINISFTNGFTMEDIIYCNSRAIVENFIEQNYEELKEYFKWMREYNSWKVE
jgi:hypothetical protein